LGKGEKKRKGGNGEVRLLSKKNAADMFEEEKKGKKGKGRKGGADVKRRSGSSIASPSSRRRGIK